MRHITFAIAALTATLVGCATAPAEPAATEEGLRAKLKPWLGKSETELVRGFGTPERSHSTDVAKFLTYVERSSRVHPGYAPTYRSTRVGNSVVTRPVGGQETVVVDLHCTIVFELVGGEVKAINYNGNDCRATP